CRSSDVAATWSFPAWWTSLKEALMRYRPTQLQSNRESPVTTVRLIVIAAVVLFSGLANAAEGMTTLKSPHSASETMDRLEAVIKERNLGVFARIDHAAGASKIGKSLRPTEVSIFGNPQGGTPFMACAQTVGIDLPLKALV